MRNFRGVAAVLSALVVLPVFAGAALAEPKPTDRAVSSETRGGEDGAVPGGFRTWGELRAEQQRLNAAADKIVAANGNGFAGIVAAPENRELRVYWAGKAPEKLIKDVGQAVPVKVLPAAYSEKQLLTEAAKVVKQTGVTSVAPKVDGSGLAVSTKDGARSALASSVPVDVTTAAPETIASRGNDSPPYWGGAKWGGCSTGFAVWHNGVTKMLSAGHCANNGWGAYDGGGDFMGYVEHDNDAFDRLLINTWSAGRVYDGGVGVNEFSKPVAYAAHSYVGNWVCASGAYSGAWCGIQVKQVNVTLWVGYYIFQTVMAEQVNGIAPVGNGDSGGPVFDLTPDWNYDIAKGTNTAIDLGAQTTCQGTPGSATRRCAWRFYYVDVVHSLNAYGAAIVTG